MSNSNNDQINIPRADEVIDRFKMQPIQEVGINLTNGYNGHLTSQETGSVGSQMVKKMVPYELRTRNGITVSHPTMYRMCNT